MVWFGYGVDPLLHFLQKHLQGIKVLSQIAAGPVLKGAPRKLPTIDHYYKLVGYCDDVKPTITCNEDYDAIEIGANMFEKASGCRLHRDLE